MSTMSALTPLARQRPPEPRISASGLPVWVTTTLDGLLAAGAIAAADLDGLDSDQLTGMTTCWIRSVARAQRVDGAELIQAARSWQTTRGSRAA